MTHIIEQQPPATNFMVVKKLLQKGDRIIFQWDQEEPTDAGPRYIANEREVFVTTVIMDPGLMKGYCVAGWEGAEAKKLSILEKLVFDNGSPDAIKIEASYREAKGL